MKKGGIFLFVFFLFLSAVVWAQTGEKVKLAYNFKIGDKLSYQMTIDGEVKVQVNAQGNTNLPPVNTAKMKGDFKYAYEVKEVNAQDKTAKINITYGKSEMKTFMGEQVIPNSDVSALEGKMTVLTVTNTGEVKKYEQPAGFPKSLQNADFSKMFINFPSYELRIGESWVKDTDSSKEENEFFTTSHVAHSKYTLLAIENKGAYKCAKVKLESTTDSYTKSKKPELNLGGKVEGKIEGDIYYNLANGYVVYSDLVTKIKNEIVAKAPPKPEDKTKEGKTQTTILNTQMRTITQLL